MPLITVVLILIVIAVALWFVNVYLSRYMDKKILKILNIVVVVAVILWLLNIFGVLQYLSGVNVGGK